MDWLHSLWKRPSYIHMARVQLVPKEHVSHISASNKLSAFLIHVAQFPFLDVFSKFWKATISFSMSVHVFVLPYETIRLPVDGLSWNFIFKYFSKIYRKIQVSLKKMKRITGILQEDRVTYLVTSRSVLLRISNFLTKVVENSETHILKSISVFFYNSCCWWGNAQKYCRAEQETYNNMAHGHCMTDI
jgi:hypothetical protein